GQFCAWEPNGPLMNGQLSIRFACIPQPSGSSPSDPRWELGIVLQQGASCFADFTWQNGAGGGIGLFNSVWVRPPNCDDPFSVCGLLTVSPNQFSPKCCTTPTTWQVMVWEPGGNIECGGSGFGSGGALSGSGSGLSGSGSVAFGGGRRRTNRALARAAGSRALRQGFVSACCPPSDFGSAGRMPTQWCPLGCAPGGLEGAGE